MSTTPQVHHGYASGSANTIRPTAITYPTGRIISYDYGTASGMNDALSRIAAIVDDDVSSTHWPTTHILASVRRAACWRR